MVFSSTIFLFYFLPATLILYFISPYKWKNLLLLVASIFFFSWGAPVFIFILLTSITIDFLIGRMMVSMEKKQKRKLFLLASLILNLGLLVYFKYANFFIENFNSLLELFGARNIEWIYIVLPIGISFFTFQKLSYIIDIYRAVRKPLKKWTDFALYILLFPQLIAGPIIRYSQIADQLIDRRSMLNMDNKLYGLRRFIIGLAKKMMIANTLGLHVDLAFSNGVENLGTWSSWVIIIAYAMQIYFDFSGYSDMAIGIGRILGFKIPENFKNPYIANNVIDFWRRWHITLTNWFRDYLFFPLAFSFSKKMGKGKYLNLKTDYYIYFFTSLITFGLIGFWHGASWAFLLWGLYHGIWLILNRFLLKSFFRKIGKIPAILITFLIVLVGWVLFRCDDMDQSLVFFHKMFSFSSTGQIFPSSFWLIFILSLIISFLPALGKLESYFEKIRFEEKSLSFSIFRYILILAILILCMSEVVSTGFNPFIYFRF
ncbi:MAG: MBOAT family protein [Bacteroidetes bacterium]|nr:MBOAT family protein [Bacteroidota bacterium]